MAEILAPAVPFSLRLSSELGRSGMSQADLARRSRLSTSALSRLITGERQPTAASLACIAPVLGLTVDQLLAGCIEEKALSRKACDGFNTVALERSQLAALEAADEARRLKARLAAASLDADGERRRRIAAEADADEQREKQAAGVRAHQAAMADQQRHTAALSRALVRAVGDVALLRYRLQRIEQTVNSGGDRQALLGVLAGRSIGCDTAADYLSQAQSAGVTEGADAKPAGEASS